MAANNKKVPFMSKLLPLAAVLASLPKCAENWAWTFTPTLVQ